MLHNSIIATWQAHNYEVVGQNDNRFKQSVRR